MYIGKVVKSVIALIFIFSTVLTLNIADTKAASTKTGWVSISDGTLNVRSGPGTNYKSVGSLKNNIQVTVYSQTKSGWSEIRYNKKKAYVSTNYLRMYSYLMDNTKVYTYYFPSKGVYEKLSYKGLSKGWQQWTTFPGSYMSSFKLREDSKGLYTVFPDVTAVYKDLSYPLKLNQYWDVYEAAELSSRIIATNVTLKVKAGTFKNVITVETPEGASVDYYAPNIGVIKSVSEGRTKYELSSLTKK